MSRISRFGLPALLMLTGWASASRAEWVLQVPFVTLYLGRPTQVHHYPPPPRAPDELPPPRPVDPTQPVSRAVTHGEFASTFQPAPGTYEVIFLHPRTGSPVTVNFTLPAGSPRVRVHRRELKFDYGRQEVEVRFLLGGGVDVKYKG